MTISLARNALAALALAATLGLSACGSDTSGASAPSPVPTGPGLISLDSPTEGGTIDTKFELSGSAQTTDGEVYWSLLDAEGNTPQVGMITGNGTADKRGTFSETIDLTEGVDEIPAPGEYQIQVTTADPVKNQTEPTEEQIDLITVTLK